jgi:hypothetical protein
VRRDAMREAWAADLAASLIERCRNAGQTLAC